FERKVAGLGQILGALQLVPSVDLVGHIPIGAKHARDALAIPERQALGADGSRLAVATDDPKLASEPLVALVGSVEAGNHRVSILRMQGLAPLAGMKRLARRFAVDLADAVVPEKMAVGEVELENPDLGDLQREFEPPRQVGQLVLDLLARRDVGIGADDALGPSVGEPL